MATDFVIKIRSDADTSGFDKAQRELRETGEAIEEVEERASLLGDVLKGVGQGIGQAFANLAFEALSSIPRILEEATSRGIDFNRQLEVSETSIAAVVERFTGLGQDQAARVAADALEDLKAAAVEAPGTIRELTQALSASSGAFFEGNVPINQQIDLIVRLSTAMQRLGLPQQQLVQETRSLVTGNINLDSALAKTLGITNENVRVAKEQGNLYGFIVDQLGSLGKATDTYDLRASNLSDTIDQKLGEATKQLFESLKSLTGALNEGLQSGEADLAMKRVTVELESLLEVVQELAQGDSGLTPIADFFSMLGEKADTLVTALADAIPGKSFFDSSVRDSKQLAAEMQVVIALQDKFARSIRQTQQADTPAAAESARENLVKLIEAMRDAKDRAGVEATIALESQIKQAEGLLQRFDAQAGSRPAASAPGGTASPPTDQVSAPDPDIEKDAAREAERLQREEQRQAVRRQQLGIEEKLSELRAAGDEAGARRVEIEEKSRKLAEDTGVAYQTILDQQLRIAANEDAAAARKQEALELERGISAEKEKQASVSQTANSRDAFRLGDRAGSKFDIYGQDITDQTAEFTRAGRLSADAQFTGLDRRNALQKTSLADLTRSPDGGSASPGDTGAGAVAAAADKVGQGGDQLAAAAGQLEAAASRLGGGNNRFDAAIGKLQAQIDYLMRT